ncbi:MAG: MFS transporter, partial [bacterium]|nr:MFS transporter [bacterium]
MLPRERTVRHNFLMGVLNGAIFQFGVAFVDPTTVMPVFIKNFTDSDSVVGLASSVRRAGWLLPQLPMAGYLESRPYKMGVYVRGNAVRLGVIW